MASNVSRSGFILLLIAGLAGTVAAGQAPDYVIGPNDILRITIWDHSDLSGPYNVEADGTFTFPLIGRIKAGGLTSRAVETQLHDRLADGFLVNPQVRVAVEQYRSQQVFIIGDVKQPGSYPLRGEMSLMEALARAGSTIPGVVTEIVITRPAPRSVNGAPAAEPAQLIRVDLKSAENGAAIANQRLQDGDTVYVHVRPEMVYVLGQVKTPGAYAVQDDMTVLKILALAGGLTDRGSTRRVRIVRVVGGKKKEISARLSDAVLAGDTIVVLERFF